MPRIGVPTLGVPRGLGGGGGLAQRIKSVFSGKLLSYCPLDDVSGVNAVNAVNAALPLTYTGTLAYNQAGYQGECVNFINGNISASTDFTAAFNPQEFFLDFFVKADDLSNWDDGLYLMTIQADSSNRLFIRNSGNKDMLLYFAAGGAVRSVGFGIPRANKWVNIGVKASLTQNTFKVYFNGVSAFPEQTVGTWVGNISTANFKLYSAEGNLSRINGSAQHIVISNSVIPSDDDIRKVYQPRGLFVFEGDSRSNQKHWLFKAAEAATFTNGLILGGYGLINSAVSGSGTSAMAARATALNTRRVLGKKNILNVWIGVNDVALGAQTIYDNIKAYCIAQRSYYDYILLCTEIDAQSNMTWHNTVMPGLNTLIYADHSFADRLVDLAAIPQLQDATNLTYFNADKLHPTEAGYDLVGDAVKAQIDTLNLT